MGFLSKSASLRVLEIKMGSKGTATDLKVLDLGREGTGWLGNGAVTKSPSEIGAGRMICKLG